MSSAFPISFPTGAELLLQHQVLVGFGVSLGHSNKAGRSREIQGKHRMRKRPLGARGSSTQGRFRGKAEVLGSGNTVCFSRQGLPALVCCFTQACVNIIISILHKCRSTEQPFKPGVQGGVLLPAVPVIGKGTRCCLDLPFPDLGDGYRVSRVVPLPR